MTAFVHTGILNPAPITALTADFDTLTPSAYKDGSYRLRRYSKFTFNQNNREVSLIRGSQFVQSSDINKFQGDVIRQYDDISDQLAASQGFLDIVETFAKQGGLLENAVIEVHQMRIVAQAGTPTTTTPEGLHQDGFDRIGMFTVNMQHATGGQLQVFEQNDPTAKICQIDSQAGAYCVMDDSKLWHYATELHATADKGHWDLLVFTANK